ncbi:MBL fold metallo-hydrolase [Arthrobacter sp. JZ12]|uniref:MBL fold metallo-hydrolase n=1 Tax=Arthrobacter sp. JZ12 TaxID=2654190 RepID=UPI002B492130|nr:MBL fold metallo-hydrolase [Arthrobacter sp. JZ12]WRH24284.1 MBL fold metallo-hydrolase [Arthrobacter sp. JZ12]
MRTITTNCYQLQRSRGANGYLIRAGEHTAVVDPGMDGAFDSLLGELRDAGPIIGPVTDILLTHYDADHAQVALRLQRELGATVWLGAADAAILRRDVPPPTRFRRVLFRLMPTRLPDSVSELDGERDLFEGVKTFPIPGHTPGQIAFQFGDVMFTGDAVRVHRDGRIERFYAALNSDNPLAARTTAALQELIDGGTVGWVCPGHNPPARVGTQP